MRPDLDDYEELNDTVDAPRSRAMSWLVLSVAVGGFAALAFYAYHSGTQGGQEGDMMVVQADQTPIKQAPANAEGEQFPNKDKTIYDVITPAGGEKQTEKLLPDPEHPVMSKGDVEDDSDEDGVAAAMPAAPAAANPTTTTYVNKNIDGAAPPVDPVDTQSMKQGAPPKAPEAPVAAVAPLKPVTPAVPAQPVAASAPAASPHSGAPTFINEKPATAKKETPVEAVKETKPAPKPAAKPAEKAAAKPASHGAYQVQLGAFQSEAEAQAQWKKITGKFGNVISGSPIIVKADLANGTFYRLRASGFASSDAAKSACTTLSAKGQACFPAGK